MNAAAVAAGPSSAPAAAKSLTSPAPVAPNRCPGSINPKPMAMPAIEPAIVNRPMPATANATPAAASDAVSAFGTRRVRTSIAAAANPPPASVVSTIRSDGVANVSPEQRVNRLSKVADAEYRDHGNQRREQAVLEQVLAVGPARQPPDCHNNPLHDSTFRDGRQSAEALPPAADHAVV